MQTVKELLEQKEFCLFDEQEVTMLTREEHAAILSLLSQQSTVSQSDEEAFKEAMKGTGGFSIKYSLYRYLFDAGCTHVRQQLSQQQQQREEVMKEMYNDLKRIAEGTEMGSTAYAATALTKYNNLSK